MTSISLHGAQRITVSEVRHHTTELGPFTAFTILVECDDVTVSIDLYSERGKAFDLHPQVMEAKAMEGQPFDIMDLAGIWGDEKAEEADEV